MINAVGALRAYLLSIPGVLSQVTTTVNSVTWQCVFGTPPGMPGDVVVNNLPPKSVVLQQIRVVSDLYTPRDKHRIRVRTYGADAIEAGDLMRYLDTHAFKDAEGFPIRNKMIAGTWFLFGIDPTDEGPVTVVEDNPKWPASVTSYDCTFASLVGA